MSERSRNPRLLQIAFVAGFAYLFFLALDLLGYGMKSSFKKPIQGFIEENADSFTELVSFVIGILGTALIQSSSSVTSISVELVQSGIMPLTIAAGIVHGANLGTSVTSSIVAFTAEAPPFRGSPLRWAWDLLFQPRGPSFQRAVGTAVVHDFFNIIMITAILLLLELPFTFILNSADAAATWLEGTLQGSAKGVLDYLTLVSPKTYTRPLTEALHDGLFGIEAIAMPGWLLTLIGLPLLFVALRGFTIRMKALVMSDVDVSDAEQVGQVLLGRSPIDTFFRGLVVTILVQSSSATTSMVVPLAALGFFSVRKVFPFIMGANIGTTTTALLAATGAVGHEGFHDGMTIALCHVFLNVLAVVLAAVVPGLQGSILGAAGWLAEQAARRPVALLIYLVTLVLVTPAVVYLFPQSIAALFMGMMMLFLLVAPQLWMRRQGTDPL